MIILVRHCHIFRSVPRKREPSSYLTNIHLLSRAPAFAGTNGGEA
jgi:hypothetical protein